MQNCWKSSQNHLVVLPRNKTGIYASDISGMAVTNSYENNNHQSTNNNDLNENSLQIRSPTATINNTRLNSAFRSHNSSTIPQHQHHPENHNIQDSQMSFHEQNQHQHQQSLQRELSMISPSKQSLQFDSSLNLNADPTKRYFKNRSSKFDMRSKNDFRLAPASTHLTNNSLNELEKPVVNQIQLNVNPAPKGFRPSPLFRQNTKFLKVGPNSELNNSPTYTTSNPSHKKKISNSSLGINLTQNVNPLTTATAAQTSLTARTISSTKYKYETESVMSKTVTTDEEADNDNSGEIIVKSNDNLSNLNDQNTNSKLYPPLTKSKTSFLNTFQKSTPLQQRSTNSFSSLKRNKSNLVNEILQTQPGSFISAGNNSSGGYGTKTPSLLQSNMSEPSLIIDNINEADFVKLLKQYRQTKDPQILNQLATPLQISPTPVSIANNDNLQLSNDSAILQELRLPKQNNILFHGKPSANIARYYNTGESITKTYLQPAATTISYLDYQTETTTTTPLSVTNNYNHSNKRNSNNSAKVRQEPSFFLNYMNNKFRVRKYDKLMNYLLNNENNGDEATSNDLLAHSNSSTRSTTRQLSGTAHNNNNNNNNTSSSRFHIYNLQTSN